MLSPPGLAFHFLASTILLTSQALAGSNTRLLPGRRLLSTSCAEHDQCGLNQFCFRPAFNSDRGSCSNCWRCCLFPGVYGTCPQQCNCNVDQYCQSRDECGNGLFCRNLPEMPSCQRCDNCTDNDYELFGSCAGSCASGDMSGLADLPRLNSQDYLFLSFLANEISQQGAMVPDLLLKEELLAWVLNQAVTSDQLTTTLTRMLGGDINRLYITTKEWMRVVSETMSESLLCPAYDPDPAAQQAAVTSKGCFCNATANARAFRCPGGQRCSRETFHGLEVDTLRNPTALLFQAVCVGCTKGQYCPEGTYVEDETDLSVLDCEAGYYCPTAHEKYPCPAGYFCSDRSTDPTTCNTEDLLQSNPGTTVQMPRESLISRVRDKRDPTHGNYCPAQSTSSITVCSAGYYCPNSSVQLICPRGYSCKAQSTAPWKCPLLTPCPEGTSAPRFSYMAFVIAGIVVCGIPLIFFALTMLDNSVIMEEVTQEHKPGYLGAAASRVTHRLLNSIKYAGNPVVDKYQGFKEISPPITMEFDSLGLQIRPRRAETKNVLNGVSGSFAPRRMNAILGPSGCGKTTFLNVLCGKVATGTVMGQVRINGLDIEVNRLKKIMGFVPQDDIVHEDLTVRENLNFSARLRLPSDMSRKDVVNDALDMLQLTAIQHYRVGTVEKRGISGGQRKRVNIGLELVATPSLLFLDEPTSGLDATSSADILTSLSDMTQLGMNVIMVIHQPRFSSFLMFDQVLLLGGGGHTVYLGSPSAAMLYFTIYLGFKFPERENPSDILMDIIAGKVLCEGDPRIKNCNQLVQRWTQGGMAWVDTLETLNPTMTTKMSEVDSDTIVAIEKRLDELDLGSIGEINAAQLVDLFLELGQLITLEDAVLLISKLNASRPATATPRSPAGATSGTTGPGDTTDGLTITRQQLVKAFQGVRNDDPITDGNTQRNAAARFYASNFLLPDLPEVKPYREQVERHLQGQAGPNTGSGAPDYGTSTRPPPLNLGSGSLASSSNGGADDNVDSDSYSPVAARPENTDGVGSAGTPVVESSLHRTRLSPDRPSDLSTMTSLRSPGNRTVRGLALLPGLALTGSVTAVAPSGANPTSPKAADERSGDLTAFAAALRRREDLGGVSRWRRSRLQVSPEIATAGDDAMEDGSLEWPGEASWQVSVAPGLMATSLGAMKALAKADVPLPELPRRVGEVPCLGGRSQRNSHAFNALASYVEAYNEQAETEAEAAAEAAAAAANVVATEEEAADIGRNIYNTLLASVTSWHPELLSSIQGSVRGASSTQVPIQTMIPHTGRHLSIKASTRGASTTQIPQPAVVAKPRASELPPQMSLAPRLGPTASPADLRIAEEIDEAELESSSGALPRHLKQLVSVKPGGAGVDSGIIVSGPVAEGTEATEEEGAPEDAPAPASGDAAIIAAVAATAALPVSCFATMATAVLGGDDIATTAKSPRLPSAAGLENQISASGSLQRQASPQEQQKQQLLTDPEQAPPADGSSPKSTPGVTHLPPVLPPGSPGLTGDLIIHNHLAQQRQQRRRNQVPGLRGTLGNSGGGINDPVGRVPRTRTTRFAQNRTLASTASLCMADLPAPEDSDAAAKTSDIDGANSPNLDCTIRGDEQSTNISAERLGRMRYEEANNSAPLMHRSDSKGNVGVSVGRARRASIGGLPNTGAKQRRRSWLQTSDSGQEDTMPGGIRRPRKDTLYVNSLLSNALVGAWQKSITDAGRLNQSMTNMTRPQLCIDTNALEKNGCSAMSTPTSKVTPFGGARGMAGLRSPTDATTTNLADAPQMPSTTAAAVYTNTLANRLDLEESLSSRNSQGFLAQLVFLLRRGCIKYVRSYWPMRVVDTLLQLAAAFIIGLVHGTRWGITSVPSNTVMCMVCLGVLSCVTHLRTFSNNRVLLWRESSSGMSILAYYMSQNIIDQLWVFAAPAISLSVYYYLTLPRLPFSELYVVGLFVCWWASGMAYLVSALLPPQNVLMAGVFISLIFGAFLNGLTYQIAAARGTFLEGIMGLSYNRWAMEIVSINEFRYYQNDVRNTIIMMAKSIGLCGVDQALQDDGAPGISPQEALSFMALQYNFSINYCDDHKSVGYVSMFALGLGFRVLAFLFLWYTCVRKH